MLIFDEYSHAEKMLEKGFTKGDYSYSELSILARYLKEKGKNATQIRADLLDFCQKHNEDFNEVLYFRQIDKAVESCRKYKVRRNNPVIVTVSEMETIRTIENPKYQKILFAALVICRFFRDNTNIRKDTRKKTDDYYLNISYQDVIKCAKVTLRRPEKTKMLYDLTQAGFFSPTFHNSIKLNYADEMSDPCVTVTDINAIYKFFTTQCPVCKKEVTSLKRIFMCDDCYKEKRLKDIRENVKKTRTTKKQTNTDM